MAMAHEQDRQTSGLLLTILLVTQISFWTALVLWLFGTDVYLVTLIYLVISAAVTIIAVVFIYRRTARHRISDCHSRHIQQ